MRRGVDPKGPLPSANAERQGGRKMMMVKMIVMMVVMIMMVRMIVMMIKVDDDDCDDNVTEALVCILKAGR